MDITTLKGQFAAIEKLRHAGHDLDAIYYHRSMVVVRYSNKRELSPRLGAKDMYRWLSGYLAGYDAGLAAGVKEGIEYQNALAAMGLSASVKQERNRLGLPGESWTSEAYAQTKAGKP